MFRKLNVKKVFLLVFLFSTVVISPVMASNWNITSLDSPYNNFDVSNDTQTVQLVNLETEQYGTPISEDMLTDSSEFTYLYNSSEGPVLDMQHLNGGLWYAVIDADLAKHTSNSAQILYNASGVTRDDSVPDSNTPAEERQTIRIGNYSVNLLTDIQQDYLPGTEETFSVNVTNLSNDAVINSSTNVKMYFTNGTWTSNDYDMEYNQTQERWLNESVQIPQSSNKTYAMRVLAYNRSADMENAYGGTSRLVDTAPELEGEITQFEAISGCEMENGRATGCEPGAEIAVGFNVTSAEAENVELKGYKINRSSGELQNYYSTDLSQESGLYIGGLGIPEINTTEFEREIVIKVNATKAQRSLVKERRLDYTPFELTHTGSRSVIQGETYELTFQAVRPYSYSSVSQDQLESVVVNLTDADNEFLGNITMSEMEFNQDTQVFSRSLEISDDAPTGGWTLDFKASNIYGYTDTLSSGFSVDLSQATFRVNDTVFEKNDMDLEEFDLPVENLESSNLTLDSNLSQELDEAVTIGEDGSFNVSAEDVTDVPVTVNLTQFEDLKGTVNFTDPESGYETSISLVVDTPDCLFESGDLCSLDEKWVNVTADNRGVYQEELDVYKTNESINSTNISSEATGNISDLITFSQDEYTVEDRLKVPVNYSVEEAGVYTGNIVFNATNGSALVYNTSLETNFSELDEPEFTVSPEKVDLGAFPEGESRVGEIILGNTGDFEIENVTASSEQFDVSLNVTDLNISSESSETVELTFNEVTSTEGNITISGNTSEGLTAVNMTANATPVQNYAEMTDELTQRARDLRPVQDSNLTGTLNDISGTASNIEIAWEEGEYLRAKNLYMDAQANLDYVANNKQEVTEDGSGDDSGNEDTGNQGGTSEDEGDDTTGASDDPGTTQNEESGGGLPIIPIVAVFAVLLIVGFVVYESYIPEEGDPLYGVLGDQ